VPYDVPKPTKYPLLETILAYRGLQMRAYYTVRDAAAIFGVSVRAIQDRVKRRQLKARDLPGHGRFLPLDLEEFLNNSSRPIAIAS
jgi:hypothetical protein